MTYNTHMDATKEAPPSVLPKSGVVDIKNTHLQIKLCVSGAAETGHCGIDAYDKGLELGRQIAKHGAILVTGATTGFPLWAAMGAKEAGGFVIGFSPAMFNSAFVDQKPIGIFEADWDTDEVIKNILANGHRPNDRILFDPDPGKLVDKVVAMVNEDKTNRASFRFAPQDDA